MGKVKKEKTKSSGRNAESVDDDFVSSSVTVEDLSTDLSSFNSSVRSSYADGEL